MLIEKVRQRTFLYDTKSPDYRDQHMRANAWEGIGKELEIKREFYVSSRDVRIVCPRPYVSYCVRYPTGCCVHSLVIISYYAVFPRPRMYSTFVTCTCLLLPRGKRTRTWPLVRVLPNAGKNDTTERSRNCLLIYQIDARFKQHINRS